MALQNKRLKSAIFHSRLRRKLETVTYISWPPDGLLSIDVDHRQEYFHSARPLGPKHIGLILDHSMLASDSLGRLRLIRIQSRVVNRELSAQEVGADLPEVPWARLGGLLLVHRYHVVRSFVSWSLLACQQELIGRWERESVLGPEPVHAAFVTHNCALDLTNLGRDWMHVHLTELFYGCERI